MHAPTLNKEAIDTSDDNWRCIASRKEQHSRRYKGKSKKEREKGGKFTSILELKKRKDPENLEKPDSLDKPNPWEEEVNKRLIPQIDSNRKSQKSIARFS
jgi:hypothetical protein